MNEIKYSLTPSATSGKAYIRCATSSEDELGFIKNTVGFLEVNPEKAPALLEKLQNGEIGVKFGARAGSNGLYEVTPVVSTEIEQPA